MRHRYTLTRDFYVPKGSTKVCDKLSDAVAYVYTNAAGAPCATVFYGKQAKPVSTYRFRSEAERTAHVARAFSGRQAHDKRIAESRAAPSDIATRNRAIKTTLEKHYGKGTIRVRGSRGTAYGWVSVKIAAPRPEGERYHDLQSQVMRLLSDAGVKIGSYDSADYGSGLKMHVDYAD